MLSTKRFRKLWNGAVKAVVSPRDLHGPGKGDFRKGVVTMIRNERRTSLAVAVSAALAAALGSVSVANADSSPFALTSLTSGYMAADAGEGRCGEGKCGGDKAEDGNGEEDKGEEGKGEEGKGEEGKCGEGKCGGSV